MLIKPFKHSKQLKTRTRFTLFTNYKVTQVMEPQKLVSHLFFRLFFRIFISKSQFFQVISSKKAKERCEKYGNDENVKLLTDF